MDFGDDTTTTPTTSTTTMVPWYYAALAAIAGAGVVYAVMSESHQAKAHREDRDAAYHRLRGKEKARSEKKEDKRVLRGKSPVKAKV
jgi:hypothetical protein